MAKTKNEFALAFTGTSDKLKLPQKEFIDDVLSELNPPAKVFSGAAHGVDVFAAGAAMEWWPKAKHFVCIPYWVSDEGIALPCEYDVTGVQELVAEGALTIHCLPGRDPADGYMVRNSYLANHCTHMLAFPAHYERKEVKRSGTWATVRRAKRQKRKVKIAPLPA